VVQTLAIQWTETNRHWLIEVPVPLRHLRYRSPLAASGSRAAERRLERTRAIGSVLKSTVSIVLLVWLSLAILNVVGVNIAPFIASAGVVGLAIGFGAQNLVRDFVTGVFMLLEDQYGVGDIVDVGEAIGEVESAGLRGIDLPYPRGRVHAVIGGSERDQR
jgi:small conductance mechanosensitive channel